MPKKGTDVISIDEFAIVLITSVREIDSDQQLVLWPDNFKHRPFIDVYEEIYSEVEK